MRRLFVLALMLTSLTAYAYSLADVSGYDDFKRCDHNEDCVTIERLCHGWESVNKEKVEDAVRFNSIEIQDKMCAPAPSNKPASRCHKGKCEIVINPQP